MGYASTAFKVTSSISNGYIQADAMRDEADYHKKVAELNNKTIDSQIKSAEEQGNDAIVRGNTAANKRAQAERLAVGAERASIAGAGGDAMGASAEDSVAGIEAVSAAEQASLKTNAWREAFGFRSQANAMRGQQTNNTLNARSKANALEYGAKSSIITGWSKGVGEGIDYASMSASTATKAGG